MGIVGRDGLRITRARCAAVVLLLSGCVLGGPAWAGSVNLFGIDAEYKLTLGYATAMRTEKPSQALINGPVDQMKIGFTPAGSIPSPACPTPPCLGKFAHTGLPITANFDDADRDFKRGALLANRVSAYGETEIKLPNLGLGNIGVVASGAAHYDRVFEVLNDNNSPRTVNRIGVNSNGDRYGPNNTWLDEAEKTNGKRHRLLEAYAYGEWYLTDTIGMSVRAGRHLAAWGESLFFPGIVSAQGPFDATKANVPGVEVKEILLPVNQVSMQVSLTDKLTALAYDQFEFNETEIYPEGDFFSPADLVGPGANFGYGSINPLSPKHCNEPTVTDATTGAPAPAGSLCQAAAGFENQPDDIFTLRTPDKLADKKDMWGLGLKYQLLADLNVGGYYLHYANHNPHVLLNMGYARIGDVKNSCSNGPGSSGCQPVTTQRFNVRVPVSYTVAYQDDVQMEALSFSTVFWVFNIGGEIIRRENIDTSLESTIAGVVAPWHTTGTADSAQMSFLYVNNPGFLYDEVVVVGEVGFLTIEKAEPVKNQDGVCMSGTSDCNNFSQQGNVLFYDKNASAMQMLVLPKIRNAFAGWDVGTPLSFSWLISGNPSVPGTFGPLYGEGDMRAGLSVTAQYLQNLELSLGYNAFFGNPNKSIGNSSLKANPYTDRDYASFTVKYNL